MNYEDVEMLLKIDNINKKKSGRGVYSRASRLGYCRGGIKFPSDYLSKKEKRKLNGEVRCYNMYEDIKNVPTKKELMKMNKEKALAILLEAREHHKQRELTSKLGVSTGGLYTLYNYFGVPYTKYSRYDRTSTKKETEDKVDDAEQDTNTYVKNVIEEVKANNIEIKINGEYDKNVLNDKLSSICSILDIDKKYNIKIEIKEV